MSTTLTSVPMPGRSPSGHHSARIGRPSRMLIVPISMPVRRAIPWWSASHGPRPRPASTCSAIPKPNTTRPTTSVGRRGAAERRSNRARMSGVGDPRRRGRSSASADRGRRRYAVRGAGCHHGAHADLVPRRRHDRHRLPVPPRDRASAGARRLRHVPGQPERVRAQSGPVRLRSGDDRRGRPDPRPPRSLRAAAAARQGRFPWRDPRHGRNGRAGDARPPGFGPAARGVREARGALGEAQPGQGGRRRPRRDSRPTRPRSRWRPRRASTWRRASRPTSRDREPEAPPSWPRDPEAELRAQPPAVDLDLDAPLYTVEDAERPSSTSARPTTTRRSRSRRGSGRRSSTPGTSWARPSSGCACVPPTPTRTSGSSSARATSGDPTRRSCAIRPISPRPTTSWSSRRTAAASTSRGRGHPDPGRDRAARGRGRRRAPRARHSPSAARRRSSGSSIACIERGEIPHLPLYLDSPMASKASDIYRTYPGLLRRGDAPAARARATVRSTIPTRSCQRRTRQSRRLEHAPRPYMIVASNGMLTGGRIVEPPASPDRRPGRDDPVRRLPGAGHPRGAPPGRREGGPTRRPARTSPLPGPLDQRVLGARGRDRAARLARALRARPATGRRRLPAPRVPRPRRSRGAGRDRAEGQGPRLRDPRPALARTGRTRVADPGPAWPGWSVGQGGVGRHRFVPAGTCARRTIRLVFVLALFRGEIGRQMPGRGSRDRASPRPGPTTAPAASLGSAGSPAGPSGGT